MAPETAIASAASRTNVREREQSAGPVKERPAATIATMWASRCHQHISHGTRPPRYCEPKAPASSASGNSSATSCARVAALQDAGAAGRAAAASLMSGLSRLLRCAAPGHRRRRHPSKPLERIERIIELEVLDPLLLQVLGLRAEAGIGGRVALEQLVVDLGLGEQVLAKVRFADELAVLVIRVGELRHLDVGLDPARLNRAARRRVIARRGQPQSRVGAGLDDGLDRSLAEARLTHDQRSMVVLKRSRD